MSERDRDDNYGETTMDEPRDFRTWQPASDDVVAPGQSSAAPTVEAARGVYAGPVATAAQSPSARSYEPTAPLPAQGPERAIAPPPKYGPTVPLPAGELPSAGRRDFGPTEIDDPIDLRGGAPVRRAPTAPVPPAASESDLGLKITLGVLVFLIVAIVVGIIGAIVSGGGEPSESTTESAE